MLSNWRLGRPVLGVILVLIAYRVNAQDANSAPWPDGTYNTQLKARAHDPSRAASFVKRGNTVVGFVDIWVVYCFQGTLDGDAIQIQQARERKEDNAGKIPYRLFPIQPQEEYMFQSLKITSPIMPVAPTGAESEHEAGGVRARSNARLLEGCVKYFSVAIEPPCNDPELRATVPAEGTEPTYPPSRRTICAITDEPQTISGVAVPGLVCSVDAVFEVMSTTAAAIGPLNDDEREQNVTDCGVLSLESTLSPNMIRTRIDKENHRVTNSTLPGHIFYPGQVVREIVEYAGHVQVVTVGSGNAGPITKAANWWFAPGIWEKVDDELRRAFAKAMTSRTAEGYKRSELHDGTYIAHERPLYGAILRFRKRGDHVVGTYSTMGGLKCYQGTITPTEIHVKDVVKQDEDYTTKAVSFSPISEMDRRDFTPLRFVPPPDPRPTPWKLLDPPPSMLMDETKDLNDCSRHYGLPEEEPPPCGDDVLKGALRYGYILNEDAKSDVVCEMTRTNGCNADNIFALMLKTPGAIAPVDAGVAALDCGTLSVRVPGGGEARMRTEFNPRYHVVMLYTLPGHPFYPATIVRRVEESVGYVWAHTHAWGTDAIHKKAFDDATAAYVWEGPNKALKDAFLGKKPVSAKVGTKPKKK